MGDFVNNRISLLFVSFASVCIAQTPSSDKVNNFPFMCDATVSYYGNALIYAAQHDSVDYVRACLCEPCCYVDCKGKNGCTALWWAAARNNPEILRALLAAKASVNIANKDGCTPLMNAADKANVEAVRILLDAGADVKAVNNKQETALHAAAGGTSLDEFVFDTRQESCKQRKTEEYKTIITMLLAAGIDKKLRNKAGKTAYEVALECNNLELAELLK